MKSRIKYLAITLGFLFMVQMGFAQNPVASAAEEKPGSPATNTVEFGGEIVPLITIDDAPLPDAIKTLAPTVTTADGKTVGPPTVSFRW
jgi:hypothetical protein